MTIHTPEIAQYVASWMSNGNFSRVKLSKTGSAVVKYPFGSNSSNHGHLCKHMRAVQAENSCFGHKNSVALTYLINPEVSPCAHLDQFLTWLSEETLKFGLWLLILNCEGHNRNYGESNVIWSKTSVAALSNWTVLIYVIQQPISTSHTWFLVTFWVSPHIWGTSTVAGRLSYEWKIDGLMPKVGTLTSIKNILICIISKQWSTSCRWEKLGKAAAGLSQGHSIKENKMPKFFL